MTVPRSVADVLADHVRLEVESIDRMYCNLYVPQLQHVNGVVRFFRGHRGMPFASSALMDPISKTFVAGIHRYCRDTGATYPWIVSSTGVVNHFYVYAVDADFGMFFSKSSTSFPFPSKTLSRI